MTAISSPLLESSIDGATGVLLNVTGGTDLTLHEVTTASEIIADAVDEDANIIFGAVIDEKMQGEIRITVIATGFQSQSVKKAASRVAETPASKVAATETAPPAAPAVEPSLDIPEFLRRRRPNT